jgi:succinate dehydrogenase / fumarate reductase flavoprotein subunit
MYHQFKQLADIDITKVPMEVGPTTHYVMGGIRVDADTQMSTIPGLFAAGECAAGLHGANRLGGNSLSDLIVFGKRAGEYAAKFAKENGKAEVNEAQVDEVAQKALEPFNVKNGENAYSIQSDLQDMMQDLVGIVRVEDEMLEAIEGIGKLWERANNMSVMGNVEFNPGWHTALDIANLLTVSEALARSAVARKESRGAQFREDYPEKEKEFSTFNHVAKKEADGSMSITRSEIPEMSDELKQIIKDMG